MPKHMAESGSMRHESAGVCDSEWGLEASWPDCFWSTGSPERYSAGPLSSSHDGVGCCEITCGQLAPSLSKVPAV